MKYELVITADTNDADYVSETHTVDQKKIDELLPIIEAIKAFDSNKNYLY